MEATAKATPATSQLEPVEVEVIHLFVQFSRALGQPRSVAEIYGLLFVSHQPLALDDLIERLNLSKGSGSQGLKYLSDLGAVRTVYVAGDRRTHYEAVAELRNLAGRFLHREILSHFEDSDTRLDRIAVAAQNLAGDQRKFVTARVKLLRSWEKNGRRLMPLLLKILGGGK
ncbi:MAG TPA: transcriptional regulator [Verrucomicrobiae bacterium]|nr:transcriptional regulator [Verrucomicrobiae bacterium]